MELKLTPQAEVDLQYWRDTRNKAVLARIRQLLENTLATPFQGIGKREPLRFGLSGCWSRRINREHRLIYKVEGDSIIVLALRYHC